MGDGKNQDPPTGNEPSKEKVSAHTVDQIFEEQSQSTDPETDQLNDLNQSNSSQGVEDLDSLKKLLAEKEDQLLRSIAETENLRKRSRREAEEARKYAATGLLLDLLTVVDDLHRAIESAETNEESQGLLDGVKMVAGQLESVLDKHHCQKIEALGHPFDPNFHEAIQMQPSDMVEANRVSLVARTGYQFHDRVLRTSQVFVSTGKPDAQPDTSNPQ